MIARSSLRTAVVNQPRARCKQQPGSGGQSPAKVRILGQRAGVIGIETPLANRTGPEAHHGTGKLSNPMRLAISKLLGGPIDRLPLITKRAACEERTPQALRQRAWPIVCYDSRHSHRF